jgi:L-alanine-DL-glutamate epimerase-like enolase superfamily enzyme
MKIHSLEVLPIKAGWRPWLFLKLVTDSGVVGWADCTEANGSVAGVKAAIEELGGQVSGRDCGPIELIVEDLYRGTRQSAGGVMQKAIAAIENALLDAKARSLGISVASLLGGPVRSRIKVYWSHCASTRVRHLDLLPKGTPAVRSLGDIAAIAAEVGARGFSGAKTNMILFRDGGTPQVVGQGFRGGEGSYDRNIDNATVEAVVKLMEEFRSGLGPHADLILDINMHLRADGIKRLGHALSHLGLSWLEVDLDDPLELRAVRDTLPMPIGSCEKRQLLTGYKPFLDARAMDVAIIDVRWTGVLQAKKIADLAKCYEINVAPHNHGSPLATLMAAHFCAAATNVRVMEYDVDDVPWRDVLMTSPLTIKAGHLEIPDGPGWGLEVDEARLRKLAGQ